jgi:endonuclease/exonuclease/phosphatase family metal-dependent hydrolase
MKRMGLLLFLLGSLSLYAQDLHIATFNIRLNTPADGVNAWPNRVDQVTGLLRFHEVDLFGLQEVLYEQLEDIHKAFPGYGWIGSGRDDGHKKGEFCPIFYDKSKLTLLENGQFWLSETPEKPGPGWDAACNRVCTWGKFLLKNTGKQCYVFNTHFDHVGNRAREKSAVLIRDSVKAKRENNNLPVVLTGDFNLTPEKEPIFLLKQTFNDSRDVSVDPPYGPYGTYNGFDHNSPLDRRIDYIFVTRNVNVLKYGVLSDSKENRYPSDHLPVFVKILLQ